MRECEGERHMKVIQSAKNDVVKDWMKLKTQKGRRQSGLYLIEGEHLVKEAIQADAPIVSIMKQCDKVEQYQDMSCVGVAEYSITEAICKALSDTQTSQGIFAVVEMTQAESLHQRGQYILLDGVQDPGNVGTIIRTADAAGFSGVVLGEGCVDVYNAKVLRSMQGSQYHIPIYKASLVEWLSSYPYDSFAAALQEDTLSYQQLSNREHVAIVVGNEGNGISEEVLAACTYTIKIPIYGAAESLNVAIAAALLMYKVKE